VHRQELRAELGGHHFELTLRHSNLLREAEDLLGGVLQVIDDRAGCGVQRDLVPEPDGDVGNCTRGLS
jgi:hypothetical protein